MGWIILVAIVSFLLGVIAFASLIMWSANEDYKANKTTNQETEKKYQTAIKKYTK